MITPEAEVKVMANYRKIWGIFIAVAVTCFVLLVLLMEFGKPSVSYYNSIQECINSRIEEIINNSEFDNRKRHYHINQKLYHMKMKANTVSFILLLTVLFIL